MIVHTTIDGKAHTVLREIFEAVYRKNGSFVDIWFERDGGWQWVSVPISEFRAFLESPDTQRSFGLGYDVEEDDPLFKKALRAQHSHWKKPAKNIG